jgi:hypothetical protein
MCSTQSFFSIPLEKMNRTPRLTKESIKFLKRLRKIQASQPFEENVSPKIKEMQQFYEKILENERKTK